MSNIPFSSIYPDGGGSASGTTAAAGEAQSNPQYPGMPAGATPQHFDVYRTLAGTYPIWTPPSDKRFVLASAFISSDTAMRVALVDGADTEGNRPVDQYVGANGGSSPNLVPVPYPSNVAGQPLNLVMAGAGNVRVRVSGWLQGS